MLRTDVERLFCRLLSERCKVDFMGIVEWFLGVHFSWRIDLSSVAVHLNQSGFATNLVESFSRQARNKTPTATPYRSGFPIDSSLHLLMLMTRRCRSIARRHIEASLVA
jgi:hypothetical protein